ncbi:MAG: 2-iminoacetate synthase ThiH [Spirochaetales bacterium]|nr:2-iminoacetate synthase ThiH [Spirochaetales bacterium]
MDTYFEQLINKDIDSILASKDESRINGILAGEDVSFQDFLHLLSEGGINRLPEMAAAAQKATLQRFGRTISFYAPIYISNECSNICLYCGFNATRSFPRTTLSPEQIESELVLLKETGMDSVLLLTGESANAAPVEYIAEAVKLAKRYYTFVGLEIYPLDVDGYKKMLDAGADGLTIYQETYDRKAYEYFHRKGKKRDYNWRIETPERAFQAGFRKVGIGVLLGLSDYRRETVHLAAHADYLYKRYWRGEIAFSFPRIRPFNTDFDIPYPVSDKMLIHMMCALRLYLKDAAFLLSTRETPELRDKLIGLCVTQMSAGSKTNPGGYGSDNDSEEQFSISDSRNLDKMIEVVSARGYEPVIKDWDRDFKSIK